MRVDLVGQDEGLEELLEQILRVLDDAGILLEDLVEVAAGDL